MPMTLPSTRPHVPTPAGGARAAASRWRLAVLLVRPLARAIDWAPLAAVAVGGAAALALTGLVRQPDPGTALVALRVVGTLLGSAAAFALVDPMSADLDAAPAPRWLRQALRCLLAGGAAVGAWLAAFAWTLSRLPDGVLFPVGDLLVEMGVCLGVALAAGATAVRHARGRQAAMASVVVQLLLVLATVLLPDEVRLWPPTCGFGAWDEAHRFWLAMLPLPYAWLALALRDARR
ncbi:hypothetical protein [Nonomuraea pusilla]|uniref:ABC-2 type transport system permease protein n=1 Tax=Nonomuraea pusilla TaxID=46177 RepID=A0A1H8FTG7_9ACTN|nr:hypothetical protein [Nonomuraea pusilla]SEN34840.1 hypothetical protein SAMN05660976_07342 [Nonomuraea pusilla]